jgi:hypothetical protein
LLFDRDTEGKMMRNYAKRVRLTILLVPILVGVSLPPMLRAQVKIFTDFERLTVAEVCLIP